MKSKEFKNVCITGVAAAVPANRVETKVYSKHFGSFITERFENVTGICSRHLTDGRQTAADLCYVAARALLDKKSLTGEDIDALIFVSETPDYSRPATSFTLQYRLGLRNDCLIMDLNWGCCGFINGLYVASALIKSCSASRVLLLTGIADTKRKVTEDTSNTMMFGDAGAASLIEPGDGDIKIMLRADGSKFKLMIYPNAGYRFGSEALTKIVECDPIMKGDEVFIFATKAIPALFKEFYETFKCNSDDFDYFILHQANLMITQRIAKQLKLSAEKVPVSIDRFGNTSMVSIPLGIADLIPNINNRKELKIIVSGFGNGVSWGIASFSIKPDEVLPVILTDEVWEEGNDVF